MTSFFLQQALYPTHGHGGSGAYPRKVMGMTGKDPGNNSSPLKGTMHTHAHTHSHLETIQRLINLLDLFWKEGGNKDNLEETHTDLR